MSQNLKEQFVLDTFRQLNLIHGKTRFFGHMKDETGDKIAKCKTLHQVSQVIMEYMNYYNHYRYQ